ncbi:MAG: hypothetical protein E6F98_16555 [Actinobacteria bacterium]|nr:MAG: hypothetical protein E6F98_16555 [Actinomycetota bacterium]
MASLQDIRRRIASVRNTRKITKALELVAGARLRRAQTRIEEMRPYADRMQELMVGTARAAASFRNLPLMQRREVKRIGVVVFSRYVSPLVQRVTVSDLLPIPEHVLEGDGEDEQDAKQQALRGDFIYEPEPEEILERLLPVYLETEIYRALLESAASFLAAQMTAMRNASKNANELIDRYTLQMNRARQAEITQEILEVVAGADALS